MDIVCECETLAGRTPTRVNRVGVGYDIHSKSDKEERLIEVKGVSESWNTYTWQAMHFTEVDCMKSNPDKFFLYIVYFSIAGERDGIEINKIVPDIFVIPGADLLSSKFRLKRGNYSLTPISRRKLSAYKQ